MGRFVSVSRSFWKESQGAPSSLPSHVGTEYKKAVSRDARASGQGHWVHLPQRHHCFHGLFLPLLVLHSQSWLRGSNQGAASLQKRGITVLCYTGIPPPSCHPGLKEFPFLSTEFGSLPPRLPLRHLPLPSSFQATWPTDLGPLVLPMRHHLKETAVPCFLAK